MIFLLLPEHRVTREKLMELLMPLSTEMPLIQLVICLSQCLYSAMTGGVSCLLQLFPHLDMTLTTPAGRARAWPLNSLWFLESLGGFFPQHMQGPNTQLWPPGCATGSCFFPSALGKAALLHAALMAVLCLVNTCTSLCKPSSAMWSLPGRHRKHFIATMDGVANNTEQKAWGVANHQQMTF